MFRRYLFAAAFCAFFGFVYELFGHGVYSPYMIFAFAIPLLGGALPFFTFSVLPVKVPGRFAVNLYSSGIAAFTVGSLMQGALDIYGTTNSLMIIYLIAGILLVAVGIIAYLVSIIKSLLQ